MRFTDQRVGRYWSEGSFILPEHSATADVEPGAAELPGRCARESPGRVLESVSGFARDRRIEVPARADSGEGPRREAFA